MAVAKSCKSPSRRVDNVNPDRVGVKTQRYSRTQMLQAVALAWGKESENLTATLYKERKRLEKPDTKDDAAERALVRPGSLSEPVVDFLPESNRPYPLVDVERILGLPNPIAQADFVRPSDAQENQAAVSVHESPVVMLGWSAVIRALLFLGMLPGFLGLFPVLPVLGHASWHVYRRVVAWEEPVRA